ncbi:MAG: response regulator [Rhodoferax sp.]|jgi:DNA-binding NarL/FixJ family response regulator|nr:response regulator [Rhodoferax sp.]MBP9061759.1 response regulator [Rhodoferax sp.]MBP9685095.1 response regulator [Rhodoferax sp.]
MSNVDVKGTKILIVDDATAVRSLLNNVLTAQGYEVVGQLASGAGLLEAIVKTNPDIVCLDYHLPGSDGMGLLREVHGAHPDVSVVMITGDKDHGLEEAAADAGAEGFISKPFSLAKLVQDLSQVVQAKRLLMSLRQPSTDLAQVPSRATAVIADDSAVMRFLLSSILTSAHINVIGSATDGKQAVSMVTELSPDIVCLDWDMPVMNGLGALRFILAARPKTKAVMITGRSDREAIVQAVQAGAKGYIVKPFHPDKVMSVIGKLLT